MGCLLEDDESLQMVVAIKTFRTLAMCYAIIWHLRHRPSHPGVVRSRNGIYAIA